jgi:hypothetical protein
MGERVVAKGIVRRRRGLTIAFTEMQTSRRP